MSNPLDHKPFRNTLAGKGVKKKQRFTPNPLSGFGKGTDVTAPKNKLAIAPVRHNLVFRAMLDGVKLIESLKGEVDGMSVIPPVTLSKGGGTPVNRPPIAPVKKVTESEERTVESFSEQYGERNVVRFIYNRHCSRFDPETASLDDALDTAWQYHVDSDAILEDLVRVESYGDLAQYFRR